MRLVRNAVVGIFAVIGVIASVHQLAGQGASPLNGLTPTHVGIIVQDIEKSAQTFHDVFGVTVPPASLSGPISWPENPAGPVQWSVKLTTFKLGSLTVELVEPVNGPGPHRAFLNKFGQGLHHVAFAVPDRQSAFAFLRGKGGTQVSSTYVDLKDLLGFTVEIAPAARVAQ